MGDLDRVTFGGHTVDRRTAAMLREAQRLAREEDPGIERFSLTQGSWSHVHASAGTHGGPGAFDMYTSGYSEDQKEIIGLALRRVGFASWLRTTNQGSWGEHWHGIAMGTEGLPAIARQQVASYRRGRNGLKGDGVDDQPRPDQIQTWEQYQQNRGDDVLAPAAASGEPYGIEPGQALAQRDTDADGLTDAFEELAGTKVDRADSDRDGLSDAYEASVSHTDPLSLDTDRDGVADAAELASGSDAGRLPGMAGVVGSGVFAERADKAEDADSDGLSDRWEELAGTDPQQADSDADGLTDAQEAGIGTDPTRADSDHDGLTDQLESAHGGDALSSFVDARGRTVQTAPWTAERAYALRTGNDPDPGNPDLWGIPDGAQLGGPALLPGAGRTDPDSDGDGLTDAFEALAGTDRLRADSDGDGMSDGAEALATVGQGVGVAGVVGTGAAAQRADDVRDADDDGLSDRQETLLGSDRKDADTDDDQLTDAVELAIGTDPLEADTDGDGISDGLESSLGGNPLAPGGTLGPGLAPATASGSALPGQLSPALPGPADLPGDADLP